MPVIALPEAHQDAHRLRTAIRELQNALDIQADAVQTFRETMKKVEIRTQKVGSSLEVYSSKLGVIKEGCTETRTLMPDAFAITST